MFKTLAFVLAALVFTGCSKKSEPVIDTTPIELTAEERQYIATHKQVTWALEDNRPPFVYVDEKNQVKGVSKIYLDIIEKKTGLSFKPVPVGNLYNAIQSVKDGHVDIVTSVRPSNERMNFLTFTAPYAYSAGVFVFRRNGPPGSPLRAGICQGDAVNEYLKARFPEMVIIQTVDIEESIALLEKGLLDVAIMNEASADFLSSKSIIKMTKASTDFDYPYSFGVQKNNQILGSILSKAIASISLEDKNKINTSWKTKE